MRRIVVVGAGCFGAWTAYHLARSGREVTLVDAHGPATSRASSGGHTRLIRAGYGAEEIYTRWALKSLEQWKALAERRRAQLFHQTGVLWMAREHDPLAAATLATLERAGAPHERLSRAQLESRWPQVEFGPVGWAILEPESGVLMARRAVRTLVGDLVSGGVRYAHASIRPPRQSGGRLEWVETASGDALPGDAFVFACGPWLPALYPELLDRRIFVTRQEVLYFGSPTGDLRFASISLPAWIDFAEEVYGVPDIDGRGFKISRRSARCGVRSRKRRSRRRRDAARGTRLPRAPVSRACGRTAHLRRGLPVREHVERRLPDRSPSRFRQRLAGRRRLGPRLQARARGW